jgi:hypothetical protein
MSRICTPIETKSRLVVARGWRKGNECLMDVEFPSGVMKMFCN